MCHWHAWEDRREAVDLQQDSWRRWYVMRFLEDEECSGRQDGENIVQNEAEYEKGSQVGMEDVARALRTAVSLKQRRTWR